MVALAQLMPASFRGARFLVPNDSAQEGRNSIRHLYPDSNVAYVEDNGYFPPEFTITAVLHGPTLISDYNRLRSALNRPGPGTLNHPWYGAQFCAVKGPWRVKRDDRDSGVLELEICFWVTGPASFPASTAGIAAQVTSLSIAFVQKAFDQFAAQYGNPILSDASLATISQAVTATAQVFQQDLGGVVGVGIAANHLIETPERFVEDGPALAGQLQTMFRGPFEDLAVTYAGEDITAALTKVDAVTTQSLAEVATIPNIGNALTTADYVARASALYTYSTFVRLTTLSCMAEAMAGTEYTTADAVAQAEQLLLSIYAAVPTDGVPTDTASALSLIVTTCMGVLRAEELQLPRIEILPVSDYPASVLAYMLYEDDSRTQTLVDLNLAQNPVLFEREADVLIGVELPR